MPFRSLYVSDSTAVALDGMEEVVGSIPTRSTNHASRELYAIVLLFRQYGFENAPVDLPALRNLVEVQRRH